MKYGLERVYNTIYVRGDKSVIEWEEEEQWYLFTIREESLYLDDGIEDTYYCLDEYGSLRERGDS